MAAPSGSTASSNTAKAEWFDGAVSGSRSGGHAPSIMNAPGTCSSTNEKSSAPVIGFSATSARSEPNTSLAVATANPASAASLTVTGYSVEYTASTSSPCDLPMLTTSCGISSRNVARDWGL